MVTHGLSGTDGGKRVLQVNGNIKKVHIRSHEFIAGFEFYYTKGSSTSGLIGGTDGMEYEDGHKARVQTVV